LTGVRTSLNVDKGMDLLKASIARKEFDSGTVSW
jgi:hypothetical protein